MCSTPEISSIVQRLCNHVYIAIDSLVSIIKTGTKTKQNNGFKEAKEIIEGS